MPRLHRFQVDRLDDDGDDHVLCPPTGRRRSARRDRRQEADEREARPHVRANEREPFKCGRCRAFIGPTVSGGRHRNHCPICLTSRHVDARRPGDRASPCRALMAPVGTFFRRNGEQVIVHRCHGCGIERHCRIAADDQPLALLRLAVVAAPGQARAADEAEAIA